MVDHYKQQLFKGLSIFFFFLVAFLLINSTLVYLYEKSGLNPFHFGEIALASAFMTKVILVLDHFLFMKRCRKKPLIVPILWKTAIYFLFLIVIRLGVHFLPRLWGKEVFLNVPLFVSIQLIYLWVLGMFVGIWELTSRLGKKKMLSLFFGVGE